MKTKPEEKKKRVTKAQWENAVRKARQYTTDYSRARWIIAGLALEVCDYSHGGRKGETIYSVRKFADEIELARKTLYQWIRIKRLVYDKLPKTVRAKAHTYDYSDFDATCDQVTEDSHPAEVKRRWEEQLKVNPDSKKFSKYIAHVNAILYNAQRPILMKDVERNLIEELIQKTTLIANLLAKELTFREKYPDGEKQVKKRLNMKEEVNRRIVEG